MANKCSMHLGVNLRLAQTSAINALCSQRGIESKENSDGPAEANRNPGVDKVVHKIAKLFEHT